MLRRLGAADHGSAVAGRFEADGVAQELDPVMEGDAPSVKRRPVVLSVSCRY